jgi:hypothetical protein
MRETGADGEQYGFFWKTRGHGAAMLTLVAGIIVGMENMDP